MTSTGVTEKSVKVGKLRPSQAVTQHGPGAVVDLPELSVIMSGINHWYPSARDRIVEPRLEAFIQASALFRAPKPGPAHFGGLPAFIFPEYLVCPRGKCRRLAPFTDYAFQDRVGDFRCVSPAHSGDGRKPTVFPARFLVACPRGHIDDFPWREWAHSGATDCSGELKLIDRGSSGSANDLLVECSCGKKQPLGRAFQRDAHGYCSRRQPWIGPKRIDDRECEEAPRTILRGASNAYFPVVASALSIPPFSDPIHQDLAPHLEQLKTAGSRDKLKAGLEQGFYDIGDLLSRYTIDVIWEALARQDDPPVEEDLRDREYAALMNPEHAVEPEAEFEAQHRDAPETFRGQISNVIAATRLREVRALRAFTRIDSLPDVGERHDVSKVEARLAPIGLKEVTWRPATELRGEGIFLRPDEKALVAWEHAGPVTARAEELGPAFEDAWQNRGMVTFPGMRYVLLHSLAHVLMREMSLDSGYSSSALRERIYCSPEKEMAGILIYTASSDSDGSLGGLVDLAIPDRLEPIIEEALRGSRFCAADPLCAGGAAGTHTNLNGAACHACLLLAETSCEMGNRLLDRAVLSGTIAEGSLAFFDVP